MRDPQRESEMALDLWAARLLFALAVAAAIVIGLYAGTAMVGLL